MQLGKLQAATQAQQMDLFALSPNLSNKTESPELMATLDRVNKRFPNSLGVNPAQKGQNKAFHVENESPHYTTHWKQFPVVK